MTAESQKAADKALKAIYENCDWSATRLCVLQNIAGVPSVEAALCAGYIEQKNLWVCATMAGAERYSLHLKPKPRPRKLPRNLDYEEVLIRARVGLELLERAQPGRGSTEARAILRQIASEYLKPFDAATCPERYETERSEINDKYLRLI